MMWFLLAGLLVIAALVLGPLVVMLIWNGLVVGLLFPNMPTLSFWGALGLMILCNLLFSGSFNLGRKGK